jgi:uncharacterized phage-associated protein
MKPKFRETKATQLAALLLKMRGGDMHYMKLIKLMYLVDRAALLRWGRSVTCDSYFSMKHGPVLSRTLDLMTEGTPPGETSTWDAYISTPSEYRVHLKQEVPTDELSEAEEEVIKEIFDRFGGMNRWELVALLHKHLPEWRDPQGGSIPIAYRDILRAGNKTELEILAIESELECLALMDELV